MFIESNKKQEFISVNYGMNQSKKITTLYYIVFGKTIQDEPKKSFELDPIFDNLNKEIKKSFSKILSLSTK